MRPLPPLIGPAVAPPFPASWSHTWPPARWRDHCSPGDSSTCSAPGRHPLPNCIDGRQVCRMRYVNEDLHQAATRETLHCCRRA